jgi:hypothetical protein
VIWLQGKLSTPPDSEPKTALQLEKVTLPKGANPLTLLLTLGRSIIHSAESRDEA